LYKAIILEDDVISALKYEVVLNQLDVDVVATYKSWKEVMPAIKSKKPDFMIVDLVLNKNESGLKFIEEIQNLFIPVVVVTGFPKELHANQAVELNVKHYLTKPVDNSSLLFVFKKLIKELDESEISGKHLVVRERGTQIKIPYGKVLKIEIEGNYTTVLLQNGKRYILKSSLSKIQEKLDPSRFVRCHRSTVVNFDFVRGLDSSNNKLYLRNGTEIPIGNRFRSDIKRIFRDLEL